jgi:hypothetical protein
MTVVKENGYSLVLKDRRFHIQPRGGLEKLADIVHALKDEMLSALALMDRVTKWADNDSKKWAVLLKLVKNGYEPIPQEITPRDTLVMWAGNRMSYSRGLEHATTEEGMADISFYGRAVHKLEEKVPEALVQETKVAAKLRKKVK